MLDMNPPLSGSGKAEPPSMPGARPADDHLCLLVPAVLTRGGSFPGPFPLLQRSCWETLDFGFPTLL